MVKKLAEIFKAQTALAHTSVADEACAIAELPPHVRDHAAHAQIVTQNTVALQSKKAKPHPNGYQA